MMNEPYSETILLEEVTAALRSRLPSGWSMGVLNEVLIQGSRRFRFDAVLTLADLQGESATIIVEAKGRPFEARMVGSLLD